MRLNTRGQYAVMAMADLAAYGRDKPVPLAEIAKRQDLSIAYLEQLFAKLRKGGLIRSVRGPGGGYQLAYPAEETFVSDIVLAVDEPIRATRCHPSVTGGCRSGKPGRCLTHDLWAELGSQIHLFLSSVSLADVVNRRVLGQCAKLDAMYEGREHPAPVEAAE
jgi:Rrf2 family transcriptional regulator, iron-sulfur cluster assembly transcription factor